MWFELEGENRDPSEIRHGTRFTIQCRVAGRLRGVSSDLQLRAEVGHPLAMMIAKTEHTVLVTII